MLASDASNSSLITALVVDDNPLIRNIHHAMLLKKFGLKVQMVENGKEAVDLIKSGTSFDLILTDWEMPVMDGVEATKELRAMGVTSMIVGVTSCDETQAFMEAGLDYCLKKHLTVGNINFILEELKKKKKNNKN